MGFINVLPMAPLALRLRECVSFNLPYSSALTGPCLAPDMGNDSPVISFSSVRRPTYAPPVFVRFQKTPAVPLAGPGALPCRSN